MGKCPTVGWWDNTTQLDFFGVYLISIFGTGDARFWCKADVPYQLADVSF
jgi:hypothetical protein